MKCSNINKIYESFTCQSGYCYAHLFTACSQCIFTAEADIFFVRARNVKVVTLNENHPSVEAAAIADNKVISVRSEHEMDKHKAKAIKVDDAKGHTVIPSLFDSHIHVIKVVADEKVRSISLLLTITDGK